VDWIHIRMTQHRNMRQAFVATLINHEVPYNVECFMDN